MLDASLAVEKAGLGVRFLARLIDTILAWWIGLTGNLIGADLMNWFTESGWTMPGWEMHVLGARVVRALVWSLAWFACPFVSEVISGTTVGKSICRIRVIGENLRKSSILQCLMRAAGFFVDICLVCAVGAVLILRSRKKQRFGDMWARTIVVPLRAANSCCPQPHWIMIVSAATGIATGIVFVLAQWIALAITFAK